MTNSINFKKIEEFHSLGFAKSSPELLNHIRKSKDPNIRIFRSTSGAKNGNKGGIRYTSLEFFGNKHFIYIYDLRQKEKFINFLVDKFLTRNPNPDVGFRRAFTRMLHINKLHWEQCYCIDKE